MYSTGKLLGTEVFVDSGVEVGLGEDVEARVLVEVVVEDGDGDKVAGEGLKSIPNTL